MTYKHKHKYMKPNENTQSNIHLHENSQLCSRTQSTEKLDKSKSLLSGTNTHTYMQPVFSLWILFTEILDSRYRKFKVAIYLGVQFLRTCNKGFPQWPSGSKPLPLCQLLNDSLQQGIFVLLTSVEVHVVLISSFFQRQGWTNTTNSPNPHGIAISAFEILPVISSTACLCTKEPTTESS